MSETCETVMVKADNEAGYIVINKEDKTSDHKIFTPKPAKPAKPAKSDKTDPE